MMTSNARRRGVGVLIAALVVATTLAQEPSSAPSPATRPSSVRSAEPQTHAAAATQPDATSAPAEGAEVRAVLVMGGPARLDTGEPPPTNHWVPFWPDLGPGTLGWFAALAILALMLRPRPLLSLRNLDGLVLAGMCLLLVLREDTRVACYRQTGQWWAYIGLTAAAAYWLVRGIGLLLARRTQSPVQPVPSGPLTILVIVGLVLAVHQIATAPVSDGSRDGIIGGLYSEATGRLPFGEPDVPDSRSPLLYLLHASALRVAEPTIPPDETTARYGMSWKNRDEWLGQKWWQSADLAVERLVNVVLFVGLLLGLYVLGLRLHSCQAGWTMIAIFCLFPGTLECLPKPEIMLPATLLTWTATLAVLPVVGGILGTVALVLAGVAWPWAWLGLPVLLAYFWRRPWQGLGSVLGLLAGVAVIGVGLLDLVQPALPRSTGALKLADLPPAYQARLAQDGTLVVDRREAAGQESPPALTGVLWRRLVTSEATPLKQIVDKTPGLRVDWPNEMNERSVACYQVEPTAAARAVLQPSYRAAIDALPPPTRLIVALRTLLEATWAPAQVSPAALPDPWAIWTGAAAPVYRETRWIVNTRRGMKAAVALLVIWATFAVFFGKRARPRHLIGALLAVIAATLIASESGAVMNLVWLLPLVTALLAAQESEEPLPPEEEPALAPAVAGQPVELDPEPRITVNK